ncbi:hypothetical protein [Stenotrophomonas phage BUCT609]|uniref:Uncharacterized protein n=1 Tax=Stenotrophomonas phage BUCT609 TaxID=2834250 RepID=A0A8E6PLU1_9CAUD|nr:hypothetical protein [Stenotrophomonas phage BUCT609]
MTLMAQPVVQRKLTEEQYKTLEGKLGQLANPLINSNTSQMEAGQKLGVQLVLSMLRNGW